MEGSGLLNELSANINQMFPEAFLAVMHGGHPNRFGTRCTTSSAYNHYTGPVQSTAWCSSPMQAADKPSSIHG